MNCLRCREPITEGSGRMGEVCYLCAVLPKRVAAAIDACANITTEALQDIVRDDNRILFALVWADHLRQTEPRRPEIVNINSEQDLAETLPNLLGLPKAKEH